jgi:hypothetical protein
MPFPFWLVSDLAEMQEDEYDSRSLITLALVDLPRTANSRFDAHFRLVRCADHSFPKGAMGQPVCIAFEAVSLEHKPILQRQFGLYGFGAHGALRVGGGSAILSVTDRCRWRGGDRLSLRPICGLSH